MAIEIKLFEEGIHCVPGLMKIGYSYRGIDVLPDRHYFKSVGPC
ncbi:hypothetical protein [Paenibacillus thiaminolyticus]